ncbi:unnamed protein product, partial [Closterium sp. Yama58-4]
MQSESKGQVELFGDYLSPRDAQGHGTWCAGAAAGAAGVQLSDTGETASARIAAYKVFWRRKGQVWATEAGIGAAVRAAAGAAGVPLGDTGETASGMAPRARIAAYKVFWRSGGQVWATEADIAAAVNAAVADGVDVLSLSLGNLEASKTYFHDAVFLNALAAGVVTVFAAGNSGAPRGKPSSYRTIRNFSPWYLTVGASSISRVSAIDGSATAFSTPDAPATTTAMSYPTAAAAATAHPPTLAAQAFAAAGEGNGAAVVHAVMAAHANATWSANSGAVPSRARITPFELPGSPVEAPIISPTSSCGPLVPPTSAPSAPKPTNDILKPDIIAPGVQLWAAFPPPDHSMAPSSGYLALLSGTSMATPHVAGVAALIVQQRPDWSPAQVMSAIMTTAAVTSNRGLAIRNDYGDDASPWEMGAGHVRPEKILDAGLTFNANASDYANFLAGQSYARAKKQFQGTVLRKIRACDLNRPVISVSRVVRSVTVKRTVTNVADFGSMYFVNVVEPRRVRVSVSPDAFSIEPVLSADFHPSGVLATGGADKEIKLWRVASDAAGEPTVEFVAALAHHNYAVNALRFSPSGDVLASGADGGEIVLWRQVQTPNGAIWKVFRALSRHERDVLDLSWSPDGQWLASGSVDNSAIIWNLARGVPEAFLKDHVHYVQGVAWDPLSRFLVTCSGDRTCRVYSLPSPPPTAAAGAAAAGGGSGGGVGENGAKADGPSKAVRVHLFHDENMPSFFRRLAWSPDGAMLLIPAGVWKASPSAQPTNTCYVFSRSDLTKPIMHLPSLNKPLVAVRFCPVFFHPSSPTHSPALALPVQVPDAAAPTAAGASGDKEDAQQDRHQQQQNTPPSPAYPSPLPVSLPYRMVYAVASTNSVCLYDTATPRPLALLGGLHYAAITDLA